MNATKEKAQIRLTRPSTAYWRVTSSVSWSLLWFRLCCGFALGVIGGVDRNRAGGSPRLHPRGSLAGGSPSLRAIVGY
jgi:hypothetical protein